MRVLARPPQPAFIAAALAASLLALVASPSAPAATGDVGYEGPSYEGTGGGPSGQKPESKLWWNDGFWWASMFDSARGDFFIFKLDPATHNWANTGVVLDTRSNSMADTLWDGTHLYVASHLFATGSSSGYPSYLYRFSYDAGADRYSLDAGFPVVINNYRTETLVIAKDSTGTLWATWRQGDKIYVNHTTTDDRTWATPFLLPVPGTTVDTDDISSVVAFGGDRIGVMWSNQLEHAMYFAVHVDGAPATSWSRETAVAGTGWADDHINLKADRAGRVLAATKTSLTGTSDPLNLLLVRDGGTGDWSRHTYGVVADHHTRPIVLLDEANGLVRMYATSGESGGTIYEKTSPLDALSFPAGKGTPFVRDEDSASMNDATSMKGNVNAATGLVVLAHNSQTRRYWHNELALGTSPLNADFEASRRNGTAPLTVEFTDTSTGTPVAWSWEFGDGTSSTEQQPSHTYTAAGTYAVALTVTDAAGASSTTTRSEYISVTRDLALAPDADAYVRSNAPTRNHGGETTLQIRNGSKNGPTYVSYLQFVVSGLTAPVQSATLRLYVVDPARDGGDVYLVGNGWTEDGITWNNAPAVGTEPLARTGRAEASAWVEIPLPASAFTAGDATYSFALRSEDAGAGSVWYSSREGSEPPELVLSLG